MKSLHSLLFTFLITLSACGQTPITVNMADYGLKSGEDATPAIRSVLESKGQKNIRLVFPAGKYHFYPDKAYGKYHTITNHDNGYKYFAFPLVGCENIEIDGGGAEFIFHGVITPFLIEDSKNIRLENFSIDWQEPFYAQGTVLKSDPEGQSADIEFTPFSRVKLEGNRLAIVNNDYYHANLGETMVFDPSTTAVAWRAQDYLLNGERAKLATAQQLNGNTYRITGQFSRIPAPEGLIYVFKGPNRVNRLAPAIHVTASKGFTAKNIRVYHAGGMGIVGERAEDIHLDSFNVVLREGSDRIVTTTADATHFCNCRGRLLIENCIFENMLDDATNVHGTYMRIDEIRGKRTVMAKLIHPQQLGYNFAGSGDRIQFVDEETILPRGEAEVISVTPVNQGYYELVFAADIPDGIKPGDGLENISWYPELTFRNNIVRNNRARSILISTRNKIVVENNSFSSMMTSILIEGDLDYWHESGAVTDVLIHNNKFYDSAYGGNKACIIWINPHNKQTDPDHPFERNIRIEDNMFKTFDPSIVMARSVDGLVFSGNSVELSGTYPHINPDWPTIRLEDCTNTRISGNSYIGTGRLTLEADANSQRTLTEDITR